MGIKRLLAALLTAVLAVQLVPPTALAEVVASGEAERTYKYVALGDSATAGYGLSGDAAAGASDRAYILTEELIADPVTDAYPAVFGTMLEDLGKANGCVASTTNLGTCAYGAYDIERVIREEGYVRPSTVPNADDNAKLAEYHDIFMKYLPEADLVSLMIGGNDLWMGAILPLRRDENPVLRAIGTSIVLLVMGQSASEAAAVGNAMLDRYADQITLATWASAADRLLDIASSTDTYVSEAATSVERVVEAIEEVNPDAHIALLGLYDITSSSSEGMQEGIADIVMQLFSRNRYGNARERGVITNTAIRAANALGNRMVNTSMKSTISEFNVSLTNVAERHGATYVDNTGITTGGDTHPNAEAHRQIAERMWDTLSGMIADEMALEPTPEPEPAKLSVSYAGHQQTYGDLAAVADGATLGHIGESKRLESVSATVSGIEGASISYRGHVQGIGWTDWTQDGGLCGTTGQSKRVEAIQMKLEGAEGWHVWYRVHSQTWGWLGWARDGEAAGTAGQSKRVEAIEIRVLRDGEEPEDGRDVSASFVSYATGEAHVQGIGWTGSVPAGILGTVGEGRRVEAIKLSLANQPLSGGIEYKVHVQGVGWQGWKADGAVAGTEGQARRVEALRLRLAGPMASAYSVWYRVHSQSFGWLGWAKDGDEAGTEGLSKRAEAIEVQILPAGQVPDGFDEAVEAFKRA